MCWLDALLWGRGWLPLLQRRALGSQHACAIFSSKVVCHNSNLGSFRKISSLSISFGGNSKLEENWSRQWSTILKEGADWWGGHLSIYLCGCCSMWWFQVAEWQSLPKSNFKAMKVETTSMTDSFTPCIQTVFHLIEVSDKSLIFPNIFQTYPSYFCLCFGSIMAQEWISKGWCDFLSFNVYDIWLHPYPYYPHFMPVHWIVPWAHTLGPCT